MKKFDNLNQAFIWAFNEKEDFTKIKKHFNLSDEIENIIDVKTGKQLKGRPQKKSGYLRVNLAGKDYKVHRLVASAFTSLAGNLDGGVHISVGASSIL